MFFGRTNKDLTHSERAIAPLFLIFNEQGWSNFIVILLVDKNEDLKTFCNIQRFIVVIFFQSLCVVQSTTWALIIYT